MLVRIRFSCPHSNAAGFRNSPPLSVRTKGNTEENEKVPKEERENIPIVIFKNEIIWIAGVKGSENYKNLERGNCIKLNIRRSIS